MIGALVKSLRLGVDTIASRLEGTGRRGLYSCMVDYEFNLLPILLPVLAAVYFFNLVIGPLKILISGLAARHGPVARGHHLATPEFRL